MPKAVGNTLDQSACCSSSLPLLGFCERQVSMIFWNDTTNMLSYGDILMGCASGTSCTVPSVDIGPCD
jgi:hypothetical protein